MLHGPGAEQRLMVCKAFCTDAYWFLLDTYPLFKYANKLVDVPAGSVLNRCTIRD